LLLYADTGPTMVPVRGRDILRTTQDFYHLAEQANSVDRLKDDVEARSDDVLILHADAVVISLTLAGGMWAGGGVGYEVLYSPRFGWHSFIEGGGGFVTPGVSLMLEVGLAWNVRVPADYERWFVGVTGALPVDAGVLAGGSVFGSPDIVADIVNHGTVDHAFGFKVGGGIGSPGVSVLLQWYVEIDPSQLAPGDHPVRGPVHGMVRQARRGYIETTEEVVRYNPRTGAVTSRSQL